jgi:eukaryotic-like serine/threonine-protein kinase
LHPSGLDHDSSETGPIIALAADLLFGARIRSAAAAAAIPLMLVRTTEEALAAAQAGARSLILDLDLRTGDPIALLQTLRGAPVTAHLPVIAFVSHVREDRINAAREAGATRVLARSAFVRDLPEVLRSG